MITMRNDVINLFQEIAFETLMESNNLILLDEGRIYFEQKEDYEKCALLRDRIKEIHDNSIRQLID